MSGLYLRRHCSEARWELLHLCVFEEEDVNCPRGKVPEQPGVTGRAVFLSDLICSVVRHDLQVQIYTWPDATLRELTDLVKEVQPAARRTTARLEFALIYPDKKGRNVIRVIGGTHSTRPGPDDIKTLKQLNFQVHAHS